MEIQDGAAATGGHWSLMPPKVDQASRDSELQAVLTSANELIAAGPHAALGPLSIAAARDDDDYSYFLQIRSEPLAALDGWEFRFDMPRGRVGRYTVEQTSTRLAAEARDLLQGSAVIATRLRAAHRAVTRAIGQANARGARVELIARGVSSIEGCAHLKLAVDVRVLGVDLAYGIERVHAPDAAHLALKLASLLSEHRARAEALDRNRAAGSDWRIDTVAERLLAEIGQGRAYILSHLTRDREVTFHFGGPEGCDCKGVLYWDDGTVRGDFERDVAPLRLDCGTLLIEGDCLPATLIAALEGRRLGSVISHSLLPADAIIDRVNDQGEWVYLDLTIPTEPLPADSFGEWRAAA